MLNPMNNRRGGCNCGGNENALLKRLQAIDFAIYDTVLYLDAYPHCRKALSHYHELLMLKAKLQAEYETQFGPLSAFSNHNQSSWDWTATPWPWENS